MKDYHEENTSFPGERVLQTRVENSKEGIPVLKKVWDEIRGL
jgi:LDH2 family malate/lactate/ureidoglycolate dehydrogenase